MTIVNDAASDRSPRRIHSLIAALSGLALLTLAPAPAYEQLGIKLGKVG